MPTWLMLKRGRYPAKKIQSSHLKNEIPNHFTLIFFCFERRDLSCSHSSGDLFTREDNLLFSLVKISCFHPKAHLVFHWCLCNKLMYACSYRPCFHSFIQGWWIGWCLSGGKWRWILGQEEDWVIDDGEKFIAFVLKLQRQALTAKVHSYHFTFTTV